MPAKELLSAHLPEVADAYEYLHKQDPTQIYDQGYPTSLA